MRSVLVDWVVSQVSVFTDIFSGATSLDESNRLRIHFSFRAVNPRVTCLTLGLKQSLKRAYGARIAFDELRAVLDSHPRMVGFDPVVETGTGEIDGSPLVAFHLEVKEERGFLAVDINASEVTGDTGRAEHEATTLELLSVGGVGALHAVH